MFARVMSIQIQSGKLEEATAVYRDYVLPVARQQKGFVSALLLTDARTGKAVSTTAWETEATRMPMRPTAISNASWPGSAP